jgi:predicted GTPase
VTSAQHWPGPLSEAVAGVCRDLRPQVSRPTAARLAEIQRRLSTPLRVAVAGRLKSGKSTLVNALIGRKVVPTDVGECTRLVTRFQYGTVDRVEVVLRDGTTRALPFDSRGRIPARLGVSFDRVSHLDAYLTNAALHGLTVIDTPGLGSLDETSVRRAEAVLGVTPGPGVLDAEAVLYVVTETVRADDQQTLSSFIAATALSPAGPANVLAVLNKADMIETGSGDPGPAVAARVARQADLLKPRVTEVFPMIGLLAETAETGGFTAETADLLRKVAREDHGIRQALFLSPDLFLNAESGVSVEERARLLTALDLYGIRLAVEAIDADPEITAGALRCGLARASGLAPMLARMDSLFRARTDGLKASAAMASLTALVRRSADRSEQRRVRNGVESLLARPLMHQLRELDALTLVASGAVAMPADLAAEIHRVGTKADPAERLALTGRSRRELADYALERAGWWRSFACFGATPAQSRVAHVVHRTYFLIWQQLQDNLNGVR